jgi:uncharacterized protein (DUF952 family)
VSRIFKILTRAQWQDAQAAGVYGGSAVDQADGFIHFSTGHQAGDTARRHFRGQSGLVVLEVEGDDLGAALRWEPSRGGELFPHLYGSLDCRRVLGIREAPLDDDDVPDVGL